MEIANPLKQYTDEFEPQFIQAIKKKFDELTAQAQVDINANQATCSEISRLTERTKSARRKISWLWVALCIMSVAAIALACICIFGAVDVLSRIGCGVGAGLILCLLFLKIVPAISALCRHKRALESEIKENKEKAWQQMSALNALYSNDLFAAMFSEVIPIVRFNRYMSRDDYSDLETNYGFNEYDDTRSILDIQSGRINGNPFVIRRFKDFVMGSRTYTGSKVVMVATIEYRNGKSVRTQHPETIRASVTKPYPEFPVSTELIYANLAAPDLIFHRTKNTVKTKVGFAKKKKYLKKKSQNMKQDFALMTNEEFEVLFTTDDRNSNHQFSLLFTPVAQANMLEMIKDQKIGYGDDFDFHKNRCITTIIANHLHSTDLEWTSDKYQSYNYEEAKTAFCKVNLQLFKSVYFGLAPLFCIPLYQQMPAAEVTIKDTRSCYWEHEKFANKIGMASFADDSCVTDCILKTSHEGDDEINVTAFGFKSEPRVDYVLAYSSDGRSHQVAVKWDEYIPVQGNGSFIMPY